MSINKNILIIDGERFSISYFKGITEEEAIRTLGKNRTRGQITNIWKQCNGLSVPNKKKKSTTKKK